MNCVHYTFIFTFIWLQVFLSNTNNLYTIIWCKIFLSNTDNYINSSNYFYLIIVIWLNRYRVSSNWSLVNNYFFKYLYLSKKIIVIGIQYFYWIWIIFNRFIWSTNGALSRTNNPGWSWPGSNGNEGVLYTPKISRTRSSTLDRVKCPAQKNYFYLVWMIYYSFTIIVTSEVLALSAVRL